MITVNEAVIPPELRRKISPALLMFAGKNGRAPKILGWGLATFGLYGPITVHPDHNGILYLVAPWIIPSIVPILYTVIPFRPYRGVVYAKNMHEVDMSDPAAVRLVQLYRSDEAKAHLWHETLELSGILFLILGIAAILLRDSLNWTLPSPNNRFLWNATQGPGHWFWIGLIGCLLGCYLALSAEYIGWGLITWAERELAHHAVKE